MGQSIAAAIAESGRPPTPHLVPQHHHQQHHQQHHQHRFPGGSRSPYRGPEAYTADGEGSAAAGKAGVTVARGPRGRLPAEEDWGVNGVPGLPVLLGQRGVGDGRGTVALEQSAGGGVVRERFRGQAGAMVGAGAVEHRFRGDHFEQSLVGQLGDGGDRGHEGSEGDGLVGLDPVLELILQGSLYVTRRPRHGRRKGAGRRSDGEAAEEPRDGEKEPGVEGGKWCRCRKLLEEALKTEAGGWVSDTSEEGRGEGPLHGWPVRRQGMGKVGLRQLNRRLGLFHGDGHPGGGGGGGGSGGRYGVAGGGPAEELGRRPRANAGRDREGMEGWESEEEGWESDEQQQRRQRQRYHPRDQPDSSQQQQLQQPLGWREGEAGLSRQGGPGMVVAAAGGHPAVFRTVARKGIGGVVGGGSAYHGPGLDALGRMAGRGLHSRASDTIGIGDQNQSREGQRVGHQQQDLGQGHHSRSGPLPRSNRGGDPGSKGAWMAAAAAAAGGGGGGGGGDGGGSYRNAGGPTFDQDFGAGLDLLAAVAPSSPGGCITGELFDQVDRQDVDQADQGQGKEGHNRGAGAAQDEDEGRGGGGRGQQWHSSSSGIPPPAAAGAHDFDVDEASR